MKIVGLAEIRGALDHAAVIDRMRDALIAQARGECDTPMPMHLDIDNERAEIHMKSSFRRGGKYFALKIAGTFPGNVARGLPTGNGLMLLGSAETGAPVALLADEGYLTDLRTAAVAAMMARELGRRDAALGILGSGVQARLEARMHAEVLDLKEIWIWGRTPERVEQCRQDVAALLPGVRVFAAGSPGEVARRARLIVTATASRQPLLQFADLQPGTHISAVGADAPGKQELDREILGRAALLLVDSRRQCEKLGELQHASAASHRAVEAGAYCESPPAWDRGGISVCDFTGLGVEDLYIAEYCYERSAP
ncbi:MAG: ornithine cyclodeaminase family protein [Acidobacteriia bacterium]|nr:ornithine cyclodeaminase family protein [Terriglobia bacterium]